MTLIYVPVQDGSERAVLNYSDQGCTPVANAADADDVSTADVVEPDLKCEDASDSTVAACDTYYHGSTDTDRKTACDVNVCTCANGTPVRAHNRCIPREHSRTKRHSLIRGWLAESAASPQVTSDPAACDTFQGL